MNYKDIFNTFSKRNVKPEPLNYKVSLSLKNKVVFFCKEVFSNKRYNVGKGDYLSEFWSEMHNILQMRHGHPMEFGDAERLPPAYNVAHFLKNCKDQEFLDFIEDIFKVKCLFHIGADENEMVKELNEILNSENSGYELTDMIENRVLEKVDGYPFFGKEHEVIKVVAYPQIIRKDDQVAHSIIIKPALRLLANRDFRTANQEYLEALEYYKNDDYDDCLTKCGSAFESSMKIICDKKGWDYSQDDTAKILIQIMIRELNLPSFFDSQLTIIATIRNKFSSSHGAGTKSIGVSQNFARYALNLTASAIILLVEEAT